MVKYYIATSLANHHEHTELRKFLDDNIAFQLTYDWTVHGSVLDEPVELRAYTACTEVDAVKRADVLIVILPGGRGTHTELGIALGLNIPVILYVPDDDDLRCVFYDHSLVQATIRKSEGPRSVLGAMLGLVQGMRCYCIGLYQPDDCPTHGGRRGNLG